jgi:hypothetical protein
MSLIWKFLDLVFSCLKIVCLIVFVLVVWGHYMNGYSYKLLSFPHCSYGERGGIKCWME